MGSSAWWTGLLEGTARNLQDRVALQTERRLAAEEEERRKQKANDDLLLELKLKLAQQGVGTQEGLTPDQAINLLASSVYSNQRKTEDQGRAAGLMELFEKDPKLVRILERRGTDLGSLAHFDEVQTALLPALTRRGRQMLRDERRGRRAAETAAATEAENTKLNQQKLRAEIESTLALANKRNLEAFQLTTADRTGLSTKQIADLYIDRVTYYHKQRQALEGILADPRNIVMPEAQRRELEGVLENLSSPGAIDQLARADVAATKSAVADLGGGAAQPTGPSTSSRDEEAARGDIQALRKSGASREDAVGTLVQIMGYAQEVAEKVADEEYR